jgi:hypothetical protein
MYPTTGSAGRIRGFRIASGSVMYRLTLPLGAANNFKVLVGSLPQMKHLRKSNVTLRDTDVPGRNAMLLH